MAADVTTRDREASAGPVGAGAALATVLLAGVLACAGSPGGGGAAGPAAEDTSPSREVGYAPSVTPPTLGVAGYAKVLCSAVFVSGRDPEEAARNSGYFLVAPGDRDDVAGYDVDRGARTVTMRTEDGTARTAAFHGDQGCVVHPVGYGGVFFQPREVESSLPPADSLAWPMGDVTSDAPLPGGLDRRKLQAAVDTAFSDPDALTAAFLVVHRGRIVAERYGQGVDEHTQLESWSMGKSLTATLIGVLIQEGLLDLDDPAPVPRWRVPGDPRGSIRVSDLLRMSSGLEFSGTDSPEVLAGNVYPDHMLVYTGAVDVFDFSVSRPPEFEPNTVGRYRNSDPLTLGYVFQRLVREELGLPYFQGPQTLLFDRIGIRRQVLEPDPYGNFVLTGYDYGTARNWARIGMLYLNDGMWRGERILPEGFVDFVSSPAPAWEEPVYGGQFWLNRTGEWSLPRSAFYAAGGGNQKTFVVPSHDLVIVRMGHFRGASASEPILDDALSLVMEAVPPAD